MSKLNKRTNGSSKTQENMLEKFLNYAKTTDAKMKKMKDQITFLENKDIHALQVLINSSSFNFNRQN